jgi:hypothetical protein
VLDPRWRGQVLIRDPLASGTMRTIFGMFVQRSLRETGSPEAGFEWLRRLDAQTKEYVLNPTLMYQKLARQEGLITLWTMPDIEMLKARTGYPIDYVFPVQRHTGGGGRDRARARRPEPRGRPRFHRVRRQRGGRSFSLRPASTSACRRGTTCLMTPCPRCCCGRKSAS